jgi:hypothetical protein
LNQEKSGNPAPLRTQGKKKGPVPASKNGGIHWPTPKFWRQKWKIWRQIWNATSERAEARWLRAVTPLLFCLWFF